MFALLFTTLYFCGLPPVHLDSCHRCEAGGGDLHRVTGTFRPFPACGSSLERVERMSVDGIRDVVNGGQYMIWSCLVLIPTFLFLRPPRRCFQMFDIWVWRCQHLGKCCNSLGLQVETSQQSLINSLGTTAGSWLDPAARQLPADVATVPFTSF